MLARLPVDGVALGHECSDREDAVGDERRQRRRAGDDDTGHTQTDEPKSAGRGSGRAARARGDSGDAERGLRGLVGAGPSQVNVRAAMRARDASRPRPADLAQAESELVVVRRNWQPPPD